MSRGQEEAGSVTGRRRGGGAGSDRELQPVAEGWQGAEAAGSDRRVGKWKAVQEVFLGGTEGERQRQGVAASGVGGGDEKDHMFSRKEEMDCSASNEQFGRKKTLRVSCIAKRKEERTSIWTHHIRRSRNMPTEIVKIHV